jgi:hypothetical protein
MLIHTIKENFAEIISLLKQLNNEEYCLKHQNLSFASIGEHIRHIIEMYEVVLNSYENGIVNYDLRSRAILIQTDVVSAIKKIESIGRLIDLENKELVLQQGKTSVNLSISTNFHRELLYNLEHSIHHQALIKVALLQFPNVKVSKDFGVAKSTIEYRSQCVQ